MSMNCREFIELLDEYVESSIAAPHRQACETHLSACPYCRDYLETYRTTIDLMKKALFPDPDADVPDEVAQRLLDAVLQARPPSP